MDENNLIQDVESKILDVRTSSLDISFNEILDMYNNEELVIQPDYQRGFRWSNEQQSRFIESILLEMPLPPIFLIEDKDNVYELIDGLQRISSYLNFRGALKRSQIQIYEESCEDSECEENTGFSESPLKLSGCDILKEINGRTYDELPVSLKIKLKRNFIRALILKKETNPELRYHMFKRLNTGGSILSEQEIRNCTIRLLDNKFIDFINYLAKKPAFLECMYLVNNSDQKKMFNEECVLKFFALKNNISNYNIGMKEFLTMYAEAVSKNEIEFDYIKEEEIFDKTFNILCKIGSDIIFATIDKAQQEIMRKFASYQFEAFTLGLQSLLDKIDINNDELITKLKNEIKTIKLNKNFQELTSGNYLHKKKTVIERSDFVQQEFEKLL